MGQIHIQEFLPSYLNTYDYVVVMDLSWQLHRNFYVFKNFHTITPAGLKLPNGHLYGTLQAIQSFLSMPGYPNTAVVIVRDGVPKDRILLTESTGRSYKEGRAELEYNFFNDIPYIVKLASIHPNVYFSYNEDKEADDNLYNLSRKIDLAKVFINSGDNDLMQALTEDNRVSIVRKVIKGEPEIIDWDRFTTIEEENSLYKKFLRISPSKLPIYRAIVGDASDSLKGIPRFPHKKAKEIAENVETFEEIFENNFVESQYNNKIKENKETLKFNYQMMKLQDNYYPNLYKVNVGKDYAHRVISYFGLEKWGQFLSRNGFF